MKEVTLKEIAQELGISITTVSKALKNYTDVSPKTRKAVLKLAHKLDYKPNSFAVNLRTQESKTIGLIIPEIVHHFFSSIVNAIIEKAEKKGYLVITLQSNESLELEKKQIDLLLDKRVDGILISLSNNTKTIEHLQKVIDHNVPLVLFDKITKLLNCSKVVIDDRKAAYDATCHLINSGCKKIAHIRGPLNPQNAIDRFLGYKKALEDNKITFDKSLIYTCEKVTFEEGYGFAKQIHTEQKDVDGVFAVTDPVAIGVIAYFNEVGIKIPQQISIIGFSNWFMSSVISPSLSTIDQPGFEMGKSALKLLLKEIKALKKHKEFQHQTIVLPTGVIKRNSTLNYFSKN
ncbi:LacI family DNA-binding transcriptional regulator [Lutibacter sp. B1]|uniref:LacI family DNA-binding transcriptional regulator n=1 Tax=Lutibacter sp. B1 TaxID=2725996 RepID=UPI0014565F7D|nr:LacI family DNA-binding transcriptional regulator [Lutibacter sp. B1]NLP57843.1 LacI family transcriptional regulator [Lutibacter sp. B1]